MLVKGRLAFVAAFAVFLAGCFGGEKSSSDSSYTVAKDVKIEGSALYDKIKSNKKIIIGTKSDLPGISEQDPATNTWSGFDVEIGRWITASLGIDPKNIEYKTIPNANREQSIINGDVDLYISAYSITNGRKERISFAGPYFKTGQGILVRKDSDIKSIEEMGGKTVCATTGSTGIQRIRSKYPDVKTTEFATQALCITALQDGKVDAVTTDEAILLGNASVNPDKLKVVGKPFSDELYGIGLKKEESALRHYLNKILKDGKSEWKKIYDKTLGKSGTAATQPEVDDYS